MLGGYALIARQYDLVAWILHPFIFPNFLSLSNLKRQDLRFFYLFLVTRSTKEQAALCFPAKAGTVVCSICTEWQE